MAVTRNMTLFLPSLDQKLDEHALTSVGSAPHRWIYLHNIHFPDGTVLPPLYLHVK